MSELWFWLTCRLRLWRLRLRNWWEGRRTDPDHEQNLLDIWGLTRTLKKVRDLKPEN